MKEQRETARGVGKLTGRQSAMLAGGTHKLFKKTERQAAACVTGGAMGRARVKEGRELKRKVLHAAIY